MTAEEHTSGRRAALRFLFLAVALAGCEAGKDPFLMVQICLGNEQNLSAFRREMQAIAGAEEMRFREMSEAANRDLDLADPRGTPQDESSRVIDMSLRRPDMSGVGITNPRWPGYQVVLGFSEGTKPEEARSFAERTVARLSKKWRVQPVPPGEGAQPLKDCQRSP